MPVAIVGDCRASGGPRSPRARQLLQKLWLDRNASKYDVPNCNLGSFVDDANDSTLSLDNDTETLSNERSSRRKDSLDLPLPPRESSFEGKDQKTSNRYVEKNPLLALQNLGCSSSHEVSSNLLPLDLIQSSVLIDDSLETVAENPGPAFSDPAEASRSLNKSYCSCKRSCRPTWKSYEEAIKKPGTLPVVPEESRGESNQGTTCWCWSSKLVLYTVYLCIVFLLVIFTEAARMVMVPITVFLIVLSLALFLFILFCVCFIIFI